MFKTLRARLTLIFIGLAVGPLILVGIIVSQRAFASLEQQSLALQRQVAINVSNEVRAFMDERMNELIELDSVYGLAVRTPKEQRVILNNMLLHHQVYQELALLNSQGQEQIRLSLSGAIAANELRNRASDEEFLQPFSRGEIYFSSLRFDEAIREPLMTISMPLVDLRTGKIISVLVADLRFKPIWNLLANIELSNGSDVYVVNSAGQVTAHKNPAIVLSGTTVDLSELNGRTQGLSGGDVIVARDRLQFNRQPLIVVAEQPLANALEPAAHSRTVIMVVTTIAFILAVALVVVVTRQIVKPIEALANSAQAISKGDFSQHVEVSSRDEVYELAQAFNNMSSQLQQTLTGLEQEIAERKQAQVELKKYSEQLEEMVEQRTQALQDAQAELIRQERLSVLGQLTATVAHEIRNPLGTVRTSVFSIGDAIERNQLKRVDRALQLAERNIIRCDSIIRKLLDYTRSRILQPKPTAIAGWLAELLIEQRTPADIILTKELNTNIEIPIDRNHLSRAVTNVIDNAIQALQDEEAAGNRLTVSAYAVRDQPEARLEIKISDTGCGISADALPKIFEPLISTKAFGVGLGLSIVKDIMEQHQGGVEVQSQVGQGTTVTLWLPIPEKGNPI